MVTDIKSNYSSPAGKEFTLTAGYFSGVNPASRICDLGCGYGDGACTIASQFRCRVEAIDINPENIEHARQLAIERNVSHLINFQTQDINEADFSSQPFDLVLAEGGTLSFVNRGNGLKMASSWLISRGYFAFSDLVFLSEKTPEEIKNIFQVLPLC